MIVNDTYHLLHVVPCPHVHDNILSITELPWHIEWICQGYQDCPIYITFRVSFWGGGVQNADFYDLAWSPRHSQGMTWTSPELPSVVETSLSSASIPTRRVQCLGCRGQGLVERTSSNCLRTSFSCGKSKSATLTVCGCAEEAMFWNGRKVHTSRNSAFIDYTSDECFWKVVTITHVMEKY